MRAEEAQSRLARARSAQVNWAALSVTQRARALRPLRHVIAQRMDEIIGVISAEVGKPPMDALVGDLLVTLEQLRFYERRASHILRPRRVGAPTPFYWGTRFVEISEPHGVVLVCAPWNYPLQLSLVPTATALFAGNAVLLKCSEHAPRTARLIEDLCATAGLPRDLVQVSCEPPDEASALLDAAADFIFFTGSARNGRIVAAKAAAQMVPCVMELGGKDPALVFSSCNLERTVKGLVYGAFSNSGQVCIGTKRIYVQQPIFDEFQRLFLEKLHLLRSGTTVESDIAPIRLQTVRWQMLDQVRDAIALGAKLHTPEPAGTEAIAPAVLTDVPAGAALLTDESFGPVVCIAPFESEAEAVVLANSSAFALSASIWTARSTQATRVALQLDCGSCVINDVIRSIGNPQAAFGGNKSSGYGRYHGAEGLHTFSRVKSIMTVHRLSRTEIHWFPFRRRTFAQLRWVLRLRHGRSFLDAVKNLAGLWGP
ncbi:MAG: aldehyde dehydrogenase family protein [Acidobacteriaceae bacterium]|jgi:acyl-CoA reductase-like NAD-dependent aldehyde dehydrogenase